MQTLAPFCTESLTKKMRCKIDRFPGYKLKKIHGEDNSAAADSVSTASHDPNKKMRKTRLVIQPTRCLHTIGFLLLFMSCPVFGDWGLVQPDSDPAHRAVATERDSTRVLLKHPPEARIDVRRDDTRFAERLARREEPLSRQVRRDDRRDNVERRVERLVDARAERSEESRRVANRRLARADESRRVSSEMRVVAPRRTSDSPRRLVRGDEERRVSSEMRVVAPRRTSDSPRRLVRDEGRRESSEMRVAAPRRMPDSTRRLVRDNQSRREMRVISDNERRVDARENNRRMYRSLERTETERSDQRNVRSLERQDARNGDRIVRDTRSLERENERDSERMSRRNTQRRIANSHRQTRSVERREIRDSSQRDEDQSTRRDARSERQNERLTERRESRMRSERTIRWQKTEGMRLTREKREIRSVSMMRLDDLRHALEKDNARKTSVIAGLPVRMEERTVDTRRWDSDRVTEKRVSPMRFEKTLAKTNAWDTYKDVVSHCILGAAVYFTARSPKAVY